MQAIISDIHSNLEAFRAMLDDIQRRGVTEIICLGDVIGYGPNPRECLDLAREFRLCLLGNHEEAVLFEAQAQGFNPRATTAVRWTAKQFDMLGDVRRENAPRWDFMGAMPRYYSGNGVLLVHGSPTDPTREYIYTTDVRNPNKMERIFSQIEHLCFVGHTHVPGIWTEDMTYRSPEETGLPVPDHAAQDHHQRRLHRAAARQRPARVLRPLRRQPRPVREVALRLRDDDQEDLRHRRSRPLARRPAPRGEITRGSAHHHRLRPDRPPHRHLLLDPAIRAAAPARAAADRDRRDGGH